MLEGLTKISQAAAARPMPPERAEAARAPAALAPSRPDADEASALPAALAALGEALRRERPEMLGPGERLSISRDQATGTFVYKSVDRETGEVRNQWPAEELLKFREYLRGLEGVLVDLRA